MSLGSLSVSLEYDGADQFIVTSNRVADTIDRTAKAGTAYTATINKMTATTTAMSSGMGNAASATNNHAQAASKLAQTVANANRSITSATAAINQSAQAHKQAAQATHLHMSKFSEIVIVLGQAKLAFNLVKAATFDWGQRIIDVNAKMESMLLLLKGLSAETTEVGRTTDALNNFNMLIEKAASSPFSLSKITDSFVKMKGAGIEPTEKALQSIIDAVSHFGGNDESLGRVSLALQQMAGKGVVSMEELRRQLGDALPGAMKAMASAMNLTMGQLVKVVGTGTLESKNAIYQLTAELDRLYGGAAAQKLNTYIGQLNLMTTNFQKLAMAAGGRDAEGNYGEGSFFKNVTDRLKEFNAYLRTPEVNAFAISVGNTLSSVVNGGVGVLKFFRDWGGLIVSTTALIAGMTVAIKLANAAMELRNIGVFIGNIQQSNAAIGFLINGIKASVPVVGAAFNGIVGSVGSFLAASRAVVGVTPAMTAGLTGLSLAAVQGAAGLASLTVSFAAVALPAAALVGLAAIVLNLKNIETHGKLATDALKRVAQGDLTQGNRTLAAEELKELENRQAKYAKLLEQRDNVRNGKSKRFMPQWFAGDENSPELKTPSVRQRTGFAFGLGGGIDANVTQTFTKEDIDSAPSVKYANELAARNELALAKIRKYQADMAAVPRKIADATGLEEFERIKSEIETKMQPQQNAYRDRDSELELQRPQYANKTDKASVLALGQLNQQKAENRADIYAKREAEYDAQIAEQSEKLKAALARNDAIVADSVRSTLGRLQAARAEIAKDADEAAERAGKVVTNNADKQLAQASKSAENYLERLKSQVAGLEEQVDGGSKSLGKLQEMLGSGKWAGIPDEVKDKLIEFTKRSEEATAKVKDFKEAAAATNKIDLGLEKSSADLERWNAAITDPNATDAQRNFSTVQFQMQQALEVVAAKFRAGAVTAQEYGNAIANATRTIQNAAAIGAEQQAASIIKMGEGALEASQAPAVRAQTVSKRRKDEINETRAALAKAVQDGVKSQADVDVILGKLKTAESQIELTPYSVASKAARSAGGGAAKTENALTGLSAKIAQLKAEIAGANPELAKWNAYLEGGKYKGSADQFRSMATEAGRLEQVLKKVQAARDAENNLKSAVDDGNYGAEEMRALVAETNERGKLLGIERELFDLRRKEQRKVQVVANIPDEAGTNRAQRVAAAQKDANDAIAANTEALVLKRQLELKSETESIKQSVETSLSARREAGYKRIAFEQEADRRVLANSRMTAEQRAAFEGQLAETTAAKRMQLERQTEGGLEKWIRESSDLEANMSNFAASGMSQLQDAFTSFAETGKFSFSDLANWAIKELTRITLSKAFAELLKMGSGGGEGGGFSIGGLIKAVAGGFMSGGGFGAVGGGGGAFASGLEVPGGAGAFDAGGGWGGAGFEAGGAFNVPGLHSGGKVGLESTFTRALSAAHFANAPKFHTGGYLKSDEVPAILQRGEGVFTAGQMSAIGRMNHDYTAIGGSVAEMSAAVSRMASAPRVPSSFSPTNTYDPSQRVQGAASQAGSAPPMTVNLNNQTGQGMGANAAQPRFDGEQWVVDIVLKHASQPGALRTSLHSMGSGR